MISRKIAKATFTFDNAAFLSELRAERIER